MASIETLEAQLISAEDRIDKLEKRQDNLEQLVSVISAMQKDIEYQGKALANIEKSVKTLTEKPAKRWDTLMAAVITGIVGILLGLAFKGL